MKIVLPWAVLCTDNRRHTPSHGRLVPTREYAAAKKACAIVATCSARGHHLMSDPVQVVGVLYMPDDRRRDTGNYRKLVLDALTGIVYADDSLVYRETWERGPTDRKNPRMELTIDYLAA